MNQSFPRRLTAAFWRMAGVPLIGKFLALIMIAGPILWVFLWLNGATQNEEMSVMGRITYINGGPDLARAVGYEYEVAGESYDGKMQWVNLEERPEIQVGAPIRVYYNPETPLFSRAEGEMETKQMLMVMGIVIVALWLIAIRMARVPDFVIDPTFGDEEAVELIKKRDAGDWRALRDGLEQVRDRKRRGFLLNMLVDFDGWPKWLDEWAESDSRSGLMHTFLGIHGIHWAWEARGSGLGKTVSEKAAMNFMVRLTQARKHLVQAKELDQDDPEPIAWLLKAASDGSQDPSQFRAWLDECLRRAPDHLNGRSIYFTLICQKWFGSHDEMFEFARAESGSAPEGSPIHGLIPLAHIERWLYFIIEKDAQGAANYFKNNEVIAEIDHAAARSVFSPKWERPTPATSTENTFAYCYVRANKRDEAKRLLGAVKPFATENPWHYTADDPAAAVNKLWRKLS